MLLSRGASVAVKSLADWKPHDPWPRSKDPLELLGAPDCRLDEWPAEWQDVGLVATRAAASAATAASAASGASAAESPGASGSGHLLVTHRVMNFGDDVVESLSGPPRCDLDLGARASAVSSAVHAFQVEPAAALALNERLEAATNELRTEDPLGVGVSNTVSQPVK